MARYRGPRVKVCRSLGAILPGLTTAATLDRPYPPGQHGARRRGKMSDYKVRLMEKQKLRMHFGILEKQFQRYVADAARRKGPTGRNLLSALESRLDNVVWRLGLAATIPAARQMVVHGHILVDGHRVDRPSFAVKAGQEITVREKSRQKPFIQAALEASTSRIKPPYLEFDPAKASGKMISAPEAEDLPFDCNPQAVIEFYSQKL
ncbi:MAG: 30S ribosomal protein S4 [Alphaproteobacteria bacterium]|nr:30S ribosomal protein S4 [Alphaproteobacteria bacterium]